MVRSDEFKTVYYKIKDTQSITVEVEKAIDTKISLFQGKEFAKGLFQNVHRFGEFFLKLDAKKSIEYVTRALESTSSKNQQLYKMQRRLRP